MSTRRHLCGSCRHFVPVYNTRSLGPICERHLIPQRTTARACKDYSDRTDPDQTQLQLPIGTTDERT